jgi:hypothetical protein
MATAVDDATRAHLFQTKQAAHSAAAQFLQDYTINGARKFGSTAIDQTVTLLQSVCGLCSVMGTALSEADEAKRAGQDIGQGVVDLYPVHLAQAFHAVDSLSALACFFLEAPEA